MVRTYAVEDLIIDYQIAADGIMTISDQKILKGNYLWDEASKE
jgi:hypothetical protein